MKTVIRNLCTVSGCAAIGFFTVFAASSVSAATPCVDGDAGGFECKEVDLLRHVTLSELGGGSAGANDVWGWTDPQNGTEYAIMGRENGTVIVDISDPENPIYVARVPNGFGLSSTWRDMKVDNGHLYVVADFFFSLNHGMQVVDLSRLRSVTSPPETLTPDAVYRQFGIAHNVVINEETDFAYAVGTDTCNGGLHMIDISAPLDPQFVGCFSEDGYTHDAQCVIYDGPDMLYHGSEICFASNEDSLTVVDVTDKANPVLLSKATYPQRGYAHQGWLTPDHEYFLLGDETDEQNFGINTRTLIFDVRDLLDARHIGSHFHSTLASDHNLYTLGHFVYEANYLAGLRILDTLDVANGNLTEVAYFDIDPGVDTDGFSGAWSVYPYFASGVLAVSHRETGLYLLRANHERADLAVDVAVSPDPAIQGRSLFYEIAVDNLGPVGATGVTLTDDLPAGTTFVAATPSQGSCSENGGVVTCDLGSVLIGGDAMVTVEVTVDVTGTLENTARVTAVEPDPDPANDSRTTLTESLDPAEDRDDDGVLNGVDCAPLDASAWAVPSEARQLRIDREGPGNVTWQPPSAPGGSAIRYDLLRSVTGSSFEGAVCVESDDTDLVATDTETPGELFAYLVRSENVCGGNLGVDSAGAPRSGPACP